MFRIILVKAYKVKSVFGLFTFKKNRYVAAPLAAMPTKVLASGTAFVDTPLTA